MDQQRHEVEVLRYAAFADGPGGGNPAGVVLDAGALDDATMQRIAADVGYSETAFVVAPLDRGTGVARLRYFSPVAEVPFCGHATVATAVALAEREGAGSTVFETPAGPFAVRTAVEDGAVTASFTSPEPRVEPLDPAVLTRLLDLLGLTTDDLDPDLPPRAAFAGNVHPVLALVDRATFDGFVFDPGSVARLMIEQQWFGTVTVLHRLGAAEYEARNLFPVGAIREDPATGSAAASTGAWLRSIGAVEPPAEVRIRQGAHVGRPSLLAVSIPVSGGITVTGGATPIH